MAQRIESAPAADPIRFAIAGDSGAWADPTADAIFTAIVDHVGHLDPPPAFFANLGDFAGPGTPARHAAYLRIVDRLPIPNLAIVGNHDLDSPDGWDTFARVHGPANFTFACGHVRFVALNAQFCRTGSFHPETTDQTHGPGPEDLAFLDRALDGAAEPQRVVLMHMPPYLDGHYAPHAEWGFRQLEAEFLELLGRHRVRLVCAAHGLAFDHHLHDGVHFVMSGGGGTGLCSHYRGICTQGAGTPEDRGALFHGVEVAVARDGRIGTRLLQAFATP